MCKAKVLAIIVTTTWKLFVLTECINSLAPQVERVILVDNGSNNSHLIKISLLITLKLFCFRKTKALHLLRTMVLEGPGSTRSLTIYFSQIRILAFPSDVIEKLKVHLRKIIKKVKMLLVLLLFLKTIVQIICIRQSA